MYTCPYVCIQVYTVSVKTPVIKTSKGALGMQLKTLGIPRHGQVQGGVDTGGEPQGSCSREDPQSRRSKRHWPCDRKLSLPPPLPQFLKDT